MARLPNSIGKYKVTAQLAKGGMGAVYKAEHPTLDRSLVLKKLTLRGSASVRERFKREALIMMDFKSDYIVDVYDHFREGSSYYIVQEFVDGVSLEELLQRERYLPNEVALRIFRDCAHALKYAHERGVVHRDIKPGNILISNEGHVKLVDFGIASIRDEGDDSVLTREGMTLGTPSYMSPEQFHDTRSVDKRADIYSLGVMLYEMTTGKKPFPGNISAETLRLIQQGKYPPPRKVNPKVSRFVARMIRRCMKPNMRRRFQDLAPVIRIVDRQLGSRHSKSDRAILHDYLAGQPFVAGKPRRRRGLRAAFLLLILAGLGGGGYYLYLKGYQYEYLWPDRYGALQVSVRVPRGPKSTDELYVGAELFQDDNKEVPVVPGVTFRFHPDPLRETQDYVVLESQRVYVEAGAYRLKVTAENELYWESFLLQPRSVQRDAAVTQNGRVISVSQENARALPLSVSYQVADAATGEDLTGAAELRVFDGERWRNIADTSGSDLLTGGVRKFRFSREGYFPEEYSLMVYPFQNDLVLQARLWPHPGRIVVSSDEPGIALHVDGEDTYLSGGVQPELTAVPQTATEPVALLLLPGRHTITATRGTGAPARIQLRVVPGTQQQLNLKINTDDGSLSFDAGQRRPAPELGE